VEDIKAIGVGFIVIIASLLILGAITLIPYFVEILFSIVGTLFICWYLGKCIMLRFK
jgi:hypothetical protein